MTTPFLELVEWAKSGSARADDLTRQECLAATREFATQRRAEIRRLHTDGASGRDVVHMLANTADEIVRGLFHFAMCSLPGHRLLHNRVALCALGGYGRSELSPFSDLDLCLIYEGGLDDHVRALNGYIIPFLWDSGFLVGYSLHCVDEAVKLADEDIVTFTRFLEGRIVAGESAVFARLKLHIRALQSGELASRFIEHKLKDRYDEIKDEHRDLYAAEPHLKESAGGLRDFHTALWLLMMSYGISSLDEAVGEGIISSDEHLDFVNGLDFIWRCRNEIHFHVGKAEDRLTFANQRHLAQAFGYEEGVLSRFMQDYYTAAGKLRRFLRIAAKICNYPGNAPLPDAGMPVAQEYVIENNELYAGAGDKNWFEHNPTRLMEVYWLSARHRVPLSRTTERLVAENLHLVTDAFRSNAVVSCFFKAICNRPLSAGFALRQAAASGFLSAYLPEFEHVDGVIRYQDFHSYPVGEHTLRAVEALAEIGNMEGTVGRCLNEALENLSDPYILVLAVLFHDLGKAQGDIHVAESERLTHLICERIGFPEEDRERIAFLVKHHILMTTISQYRDIDDEHIVQQFAETMKNEQRLRALFVLSYADLKAVGPTVWNEWKGTLLLNLYLRTVRRLLGKAETANDEFWQSPKAVEIANAVPPALRGDVEAHLRGLGQRYFMAYQPDQIARHIQCVADAQKKGLAVQYRIHPLTGVTDVVICTRDAHGLFSKIAGCFASQLVDINEAALFTRPDGMVVDCFSVCNAKHLRPLTTAQEEKVEEVLRSVLINGDDVQVHVDRAMKRLFALLQPRVPVPTRIGFDNLSSRTHSIIDIETGDRTGLLYDITRAMSESGLDIATARIVTDARRVRDSFYVTRDTTKIEDEDSQTAIREALHSAIHPRAAAEVKGGRT